MAENEGEGDDQQDNINLFMKQGIVGLQLDNTNFLDSLKSDLQSINASDLLVTIVLSCIKPQLSGNALLSKHTRRDIWKMFNNMYEPIVSLFYSRWLELGLYVGFNQEAHNKMIQEGTLNASTLVQDYDKTDLLLDTIIAPNLLNALSRTNTEDHIGTLAELLNKIAKDITHRIVREGADKGEFSKETGMGGLG